MSAERPHLRCPQCGAHDVFPLVAICYFDDRSQLGLVLGYPQSFPFLAPSCRHDLQRQRYLKEFIWDRTTERPTWWCNQCEQPIVSFGSNNEELLAQAWSYIESTYVPTPDEFTISGRRRLKVKRKLAFLRFLTEVIPQALLEHATAIRLNESAFSIKGKWVSMTEFENTDDVIGAVLFGHLRGNYSFTEGQPTTVSNIVPVHQHECHANVTLRPTCLDQCSVELELLDHNYPTEFLKEIAFRERKAL